MIVNRQAVQQAIDVLNRVHAADPTVLPALIDHRVPCNIAVADDETVQVGITGGEWTVGLLGIVNGLFGVDVRDRGWIMAEYADDGTLSRFAWSTDPPDPPGPGTVIEG